MLIENENGKFEVHTLQYYYLQETFDLNKVTQKEVDNTNHIVDKETYPDHNVNTTEGERSLCNELFSLMNDVVKNFCKENDLEVEKLSYYIDDLPNKSDRYDNSDCSLHVDLKTGPKIKLY